MDSDPAVSALPHAPSLTTASARPLAAESRWPVWAAWALAALHFAWLQLYWAPAIMSPDANGYVAQSRLLAEEGRTWFTPSSTVQYVGMHWLETTPGVFHSRYPAGLPLVMALAWKVGGLKAALLINPLLASATVLLVFFLARRITAGWAALVAAAVVALVPVANQHALDADAHVAASCCLVAGVFALLRFGETLRARTGFAAGLLLGLVPTIRYPEAIVGLSVAGWLLWCVRPWWRAWPAVLGAALPIAALCIHNAVAYGAFWRTGYALTNEQTGFGLGYFAAHALPYLQGLSGPGLALFFGFGVAGLAALAADRATRRVGLAFAGLVVPLVLLYMAYYFGGGGGMGAGGNLRFLIPTLPFFAIGGAWLLAAMAERLGPPGRVAAGVVIALQFLLGGGASHQMLTQTGGSIGAAARVRALAEKQIPAGSVLIVERTLAESLDAVGNWKLVEENFVAAGGPRGFGAPGFAGGPAEFGPPGGGEFADGSAAPNPRQIGKNQAQQARYAGLRGEELRARIWADVNAWAAGRPVFWLTRMIDRVENALPAGADYESIAEVDAPAIFGPGGGGPARGGPALGGPGAPGGMGGRGPGRGPGMQPNMGGPGRGGRGFGGAPAGAFGPGGRGAAAPGGATAKLRLLRVIPAKS